MICYDHGIKRGNPTKHLVYMLFLCMYGTSIVPMCLVDTIVFSYNRPMQLYALLESMNAHLVDGRGATYVVYRADDDAYTKSYRLVHEQFPDTMFIQQGSNPAEDFKLLTLQALDLSKASYVMFAVDDIIVTNSINLTECIAALEATQAYGFYMRLGANLTTCYMGNRVQSVPHLQKITESIVAWQFHNAELDWNYPNTVDMTIYRKKDVEHALQQLSYASPNLLEAYWHQQGLPSCYTVGLCYETSRVVNVPYNQVQTMWHLPHMHEHTAQDLLELFMSDKKIAIDDLSGINNTSAHMEYLFRFIDR